MSTAIGPVPRRTAGVRDLVEVRLRRFDVRDYHRLGEAGILSPQDRVELIRGEIVEMTPIGSRHAMCVVRLTELFARRLAGQALTAVQNPVRLSRHSEPQPDVSLLRPADYSSRLPSGRDVLLVVEVCDTSLEFDRSVKTPLYARAGIPEVWMVDLEGEAIEIFRLPSRTGYKDVSREVRGETVAPVGFPGLVVGVDEVLGPGRRRSRQR